MGHTQGKPTLLQEDALEIDYTNNAEDETAQASGIEAAAEVRSKSLKEK